ncbi:MAG TPA: PilN domain-containing protein [Solirubrobacterales bacterium]|nr:PilN domain-containing protein [Solirubrobacterales bacterium]
MRPINLIPPESRRGASAPMRTGPLPYLLVGGLALALAGVALLVLAGNTVSDREAEVAQLEREDARSAAKAQRLSAFTQFRAMQQTRMETIASLADSRFDWERVMRELALVLPDDAWLVNLSATASPESGGSEGGGGLRASAPGPALELDGCAAGQEAVAGFVTALKDIDGVTRVGVESSALGDPEESSGGEDGANEDCRTRAFIAQFSIVVAFDAAPVPPSAEEAPVAVEPPAEGEGAESEGEEG